MSTEPDAHERKGSVANAKTTNPRYKRGLVEAIGLGRSIIYNKFYRESNARRLDKKYF